MPNTDIRPLLEAIIKHKATASQNRMMHEFKTAHDLAKQAFDGVCTNAQIIRKAAEPFEGRDKVVFSAMTNIANIIDRQIPLF